LTFIIVNVLSISVSSPVIPELAKGFVHRLSLPLR
jgi:hypothetical protein